MTAERAPILVVEDDLDVSEALRDSLEEAGYAVETASDGIQALAYLQEGRAASLILLDVMMPRMDGFRFRAEQLAEPAFADIPVVVITANKALSEQYRRYGACELITKPIVLDELLDTIERYVR